MKLRTLITRSLPVLLALCLAAPALAAERPAAPNFTLRTLKGERVRLSDFKGKVVVLSFWATWCGPCKQELPVLQALAEKHAKDDLVVIGVNIDDPKTVANVRRFVANRNLTIRIGMDQGSRVLSRFNPRGSVPFLQLIDREGRRAFHHLGFSTGEADDIEHEVATLLAEKPETTASK